MSLVTYHLSLPLKFSAGQLFELMLPVSFALSAIASTWVLASARRHRMSAARVTFWTLGTLFFPLVILPLYLLARSAKRRSEKAKVAESDVDSENPADEKKAERSALRWVLPPVYLILMLSLDALYFYTDSMSVDARLARANQARVREDREGAVEEYRAALRLEDDAHTHNLLAKEYVALSRWEEALREFRIAERMGEADEELYYNIAEMLDQLKRSTEALPEYERFLQGSLCAELAHDKRCVAATRRVKEIRQGKPRST